MTTNRFHKAAKDNLIEILKETTTRDCNSKDEQDMTPTLYAAFHGNLDALRLLCGRGGEPDKSDLFGNTALHLAAAQGHKHIVTFLVNFGANIYATDVDGRTARELAGINGRDEILRYIDGVQGKLEATDKKKAKAMQDKAAEYAKKRVKKFNTLMSKQDQVVDKADRRKSGKSSSMMQSLRTKIIGGSMTNLISNNQPERRKTYSDMITGGTVTSKGTMSAVHRKILTKNNRLEHADDEFKVSGIEDGKRTVNSLRGIRRGSEVLLGGTLENANFARRGRLDGIFNEAEYEPPAPPGGALTRSKSQPDFLQDVGKEDNKQHQRPSIFVRPGLGSYVIRKGFSNTFGGLYGGSNLEQESSIGSGESYGPTRQSTDDELSVSESSEDEDDNPNGPLERFLTAFSLSEYLPKFISEKIDLDVLITLTESDLKSLNLPLGSYRKLVNAINERKAALENPGEVRDSAL